jgi:hypothetical protein
MKADYLSGRRVTFLEGSKHSLESRLPPWNVDMSLGGRIPLKKKFYLLEGRLPHWRKAALWKAGYLCKADVPK